MQNSFDTYINSVAKKFSRSETSEMGYRTDFELLLVDIFSSVKVLRIDHDAKATKGNKPDFIIRNHDIPILYIEVKDLVQKLDDVEKSDQMSRYFGYANLILSDYVEFRFYRNGLPYGQPIKLADKDVKHRTISPIPENYDSFAKTISDFTRSHKEPIKSGKHLSKIMGGKAQRIRDNIKQFLSDPSDKNRSILNVYDTLKKQLVHELSLDSFADMYAQTLVYGLFVARYHDESPDNFTRQEARDLVPASNPLLRHFFDHIVGADFDRRLEHIVNELCEVFEHSNVQELMKEYFQDDMWGETHEAPDPVIHFYEDFLKEYDADLRKKLGAFYTPLPVVRFIVRSVDKILERDFGLAQGLADTSKTDKGIHKVQILDPATGTGTFISAAIRSVYERILKSGQKGRWTSYVHHDLLPRLHGFELMMAPYTIAHLKLSMAFKATGFKYFNRRLGIYLTNSLEESEEKEDLFKSIGFAESIAEESREASKIKNQSPIMVVIGNPPYSVSSSNKGDWIRNLIQEYKNDLNEKNIQPLSDDYIKFIRFAEHFIEKNNSGVVAMITNNSFIDGIIHRQMRKHLLETFDDIYILDLHGNSKKKEKSPDGSKDENVFDIMQGVSINIFVKKNTSSNELANVFHHELYGLRELKFKFLKESNVLNIHWKNLDYTPPYYFFVPKDFSIEEVNDFSILDIFLDNSISIVFGDKKNLLSFDKKDNLQDEILIGAFDFRYTRFGSDLQRARQNIMNHLFNSENNLALIVAKQSKNTLAFVSKKIISKHALTDASYTFPLYKLAIDGSKVSNLNPDIVAEIENTVGRISPEDVLDYIYAVLHSPNYREKYKEFLKSDFPRIPYPSNEISFDKLVKLGNELRHIHLLDSPVLNQFLTTFPEEGNDVVEKITYKNNNVYINKSQFFGNVPEIAWNFFIGSYQPAQKWLKDRKGRTLSNEEIVHYQKIIVALSETNRIINLIDK